MKTQSRILTGMLVALLLTFSSSSRAAAVEAQAAPTIDGTWRWNFTMPDGTPSRPKLTLAITNGLLTGTASFRPGTETSITNAVLKGNELHFEVVRQRDGREIVTTYAGVWDGKTIKGKVESNWAGEKQAYDWEAHRAHEGASGTWKWTVKFGERKFEARVELEQDGEALTGTMPAFGRGRRKIEIKNGSVKNGEVYFEVERGTEDNKSITTYRGKQTGDVLKGTIESNFFGEERTDDWEAKRVD